MQTGSVGFDCGFNAEFESSLGPPGGAAQANSGAVTAADSPFVPAIEMDAAPSSIFCPVPSCPSHAAPP